MFIARQPIFNKSLKVYGYELLYRENSDSKTFDNVDPTKATASVLGGLFENGIDDIVGDKKAFINFDYDFLMSDVVELIDPNTLVIEVLEDIRADEKIIDRLKYLKNKGYE
ncbi:MAG: EAL and HDOD domain-containing protein, partial [Senegalia sp. (in: firmicutes)]